MTYLLDTNIVSFFLHASREQELAVAAKTTPLAIVGEVRVELAADPRRGGGAFAQWLGNSNIEVKEIVLGSPAHAALAQLLVGSTTAKNLGERASVALTLSDPTFTFVTYDKNATWLALRELWAPGEHLLGVAPFLRRLFEDKSLIDVAAIDDVIASTDIRPSWWGTWRASIK